MQILIFEDHVGVHSTSANHHSLNVFANNVSFLRSNTSHLQGQFYCTAQLYIFMWRTKFVCLHFTSFPATGGCNTYLFFLKINMSGKNMWLQD